MPDQVEQNKKFTEANWLQKEYLTLEETAKYLGRSKSAVYKYCSRNLFPYIKLQGKTLIKRADLIEWIESHRIASIYETENQSKEFFRKAV